MRFAGTAPAARRYGQRVQQPELADETPVAFVYDGSTYAVMLATPEDLVDFAVGFSLTEALCRTVPSVEIVQRTLGMEARVELEPAEALAYRARMRSGAGARAVTGHSSCGLCGVSSLAAALRVPATVRTGSLQLTPAEARAAVNALRHYQPMHDRTRATHAAGLLVSGQGLIRVREDIGRHNALDKLVGATARAGATPDDSVVVLTSRVSLEMVQKAAALGAAAIVAASAPTALAVRAARAAGLTLIGNARDERVQAFSHAHRLVGATPDRKPR